MRLPKFSKKVMAIGAAMGIAMGTAGIAAAYFTNNGTGTGHAVVGTSGAFTATFTKVTPADLYPNTTQKVTLTLKNTGAGTQHYTITTGDYAFSTTHTPTVTKQTGAVATGCKLSWFSFVTGSGTTAGTLAGGATTPITVTVHMNNGTGTDSTQNTCKNVTPKFTLSFTG